MEEKNENILFKSEGSPEKRKKLLKLLSKMIIVLGIVIVVCVSFLSGGIEKLSLFGIGAIILGIIFFIYQKSFDNMGDSAKLYLYDNHMEGVQVSPIKEFSLRYSEIQDVQKVSAFGNDVIMIKTNTDFYTVLTNEIDIAYKIICNNVYGEE